MLEMYEMYEYVRSHPILNIIFFYFLGLLYCIVGTALIGIINLCTEGDMFGDAKFIAVLLWPIVLFMACVFLVTITPIFICSIIYEKITE